MATLAVWPIQRQQGLACCGLGLQRARVELRCGDDAVKPRLGLGQLAQPCVHQRQVEQRGTGQLEVFH